MEIKDKKIIVFGLGITGISSIKALAEMGADTYVYDDRSFEQVKEILEKIVDQKYTFINSMEEIRWEDFYCIVKSPGIRLDNRLLVEARKNGLPVYSDIELAYKIWGGDKFIAVTGTNGKTTITSMVAHILNYAGVRAKIVGNIGVGLLYEMLTNGLDYIYVLELSSFHLSSIEDFRASVAIISNVAVDHLDWHGSVENYQEAKTNIFKNAKSSDKIILNKDDEFLSSLKLANAKYFSLKEESDAYYKDGKINYYSGEFDRNKLKLLGNHNVANTLAAILAVEEFAIDDETLVDAVAAFKSIEHRIEYVNTLNGVSYYNDSKGTNIDSTKVALEGFEDNVILIAGGYDKNVSFDVLFDGNKNIKQLILFGATKEKLKSSAEKFNIENIKVVHNLDQAVSLAKEIAVEGDSVLFSPACASWDMYKSYEERGRHFKSLV